MTIIRHEVLLWQQSPVIALALPEPSPPKQLCESEGKSEDDTDGYIDKDTDKDRDKEKDIEKDITNLSTNIEAALSFNPQLVNELRILLNNVLEIG